MIRVPPRTARTYPLFPYMTLFRANEAGQRGYSIWYSRAGYIYVSGGRGGSNETLETVGGSVPQGQWTHVAVEIERGSGAMRIYLNGVLATSRTITATPHNGSPDKPLYIGPGPEYDDSYQRFEGGPAELRIWNRARGPDATRDQILGAAPARAPRPGHTTSFQT